MEPTAAIIAMTGLVRHHVAGRAVSTWRRQWPCGCGTPSHPRFGVLIRAVAPSRERRRTHRSRSAFWPAPLHLRARSPSRQSWL